MGHTEYNNKPSRNVQANTHLEHTYSLVMSCMYPRVVTLVAAGGQIHLSSKTVVWAPQTRWQCTVHHQPGTKMVPLATLIGPDTKGVGYTTTRTRHTF